MDPEKLTAYGAAVLGIVTALSTLGVAWYKLRNSASVAQARAVQKLAHEQMDFILAKHREFAGELQSHSQQLREHLAEVQNKLSKTIAHCTALEARIDELEAENLELKEQLRRIIDGKEN